MSTPLPVTVPLLNPNEPEALLAALYVQEGQLVEQGARLCTLETTKSTSDLHAEAAGYVAGLQAQEGDTLLAGEVLCYLAADRDWKPVEDGAPPEREAASRAGATIPDGVRISRPALAFAQRAGIDLRALPAGPLITREMLEKWAAGSPQSPTPESEFDPTAIIVYGGGGHGKAVIDLLRALGTYRLTGVVDDGLPVGELVAGAPVLGGEDRLVGLRAQGVRLAVNAVGGIGNVQARVRVFERLAEAGFVCPAVVHPTAFVETSAALEAGVQVFPHAYVGSEARVGFGVIVNTGAILSHDCVVAAYANLSPGAMLAGGVRVGARALVGMGVTVNLGVRIGARARIGNGATVKADVPEGGVVRAGSVWPIDSVS